MDITDDDNFLHSASSPEIGTIRLDIWNVQTHRATSHSFLPIILPPSGKVHELSKKSVDHRVESVDHPFLSTNSLHMADLAKRHITPRGDLSGHAPKLDPNLW